MIWDDLLQAVRAELTRRAGDAAGRTKAISTALDVYVRAHEARIVSDFAARNGLPPPASSEDIEAAALRLRELVAALPELHADESSDAPKVPDASAVAAAISTPSAPPVRQETMELLTLEEAQRQLASEFDAARFSSMRLDQFLLFAEEFAATARALQERTGGDPLSQRVIRKLTALVHERELPRKVFGLSRGHSGDWQRLANEARARRRKAEGEDHRVG